MRILAVDDEKLMLEALKNSIAKAAPDAEIQAFRRSSEALTYAANHPIDVAFLDIQMRGMDGLELGKQLLVLYPDLNLIYCTGYDEYISEAFREVRCNGYITKPVDAEQIIKELEHLRLPMRTGQKNRVFFRCLGRFEAFVDGEPILFETSKTKELLAFLVHAGGGVCSNQEIIAELWDDDAPHDSYFKKLRKDLLDTLERYECSEILHRQRGGLGIDQTKVSCDYYEWKNDHAGTKPQEYMTQYVWANVPYYEW